MSGNDYQLVTLAALLHDLGKLIRCQLENQQKSKPYGRASQQEGHHARDGVRFLEYCGATQLAQWPLLRDLIDQHHSHQWQPNHVALGWLVSKADHFSSKERLDEEQTQESPELESIFGQVQTIYPLPTARQYYAARPLAPFFGFPRPNQPQFSHFDPIISQVETQTRALLAAVHDPAHLLVAFTDLLEQYATMTSANKGSRPRDISLFDHLTTSAAIAACLYLWHSSHNRWDDAAIQDESAAKFLLIGGDLSGIQKYLYEIARISQDGGVARRLRARSFYLTALQDVIAFRLCCELVAHLDAILPMNCQLLNTGGRFLLLAPNLPEVITQLTRLDREINDWLRAETHGDLACYFTHVPLAGIDFVPEAKFNEAVGSSNITRKIAKVYQQLTQAKARRYHTLLRTQPDVAPGQWADAFVQRTGPVHYLPGDGEGVGGACRVCRKLPVDSHVVAKEGRNLCRRCAEDRVLGRSLIEATLLGYRQGDALPHADALDLHFFGEAHRYTLRLTATPDALTAFAPQYVEALAVDPTLGDLYQHRQAQVIMLMYRHPTRQRLLANYVPLNDNGEIQTFSKLADCAGRPEVLGTVEPLLGVVKMDVDQLGLLIAEGLGAATSISRVATFSRMLDLFFSGWIDTRLRHSYAVDERGRPQRTDTGFTPNPLHTIYTVYAGGDDLLLVGPWDKAIVAAQLLQAEFAAFTVHNPNLTLSASVVVIKPHYPVAKAAQRAGDLLESHAKAAGRNRFHLFGITTPWFHRTPVLTGDAAEDGLRQALHDQDLGVNRQSQSVTTSELWTWADFFDQQLFTYRQARNRGDSRYPVSNLLLHRILRLSKLSQPIAQRGYGQIEELTYMAHLAYFLGRSIRPEQYVQSAPEMAATLRDVLAKLMELTQFQNLHLMAHMQLPLTWALYRNRLRSEGRE